MTNSAFVMAAIAVFIYFHAVFLMAVWFRRNDFADVAWGPGFLVGGFGAWLSLESPLNMRLLLGAALIAVWACRLTWHIGVRNLSHSNEDSRYANWRKDWGHNWLWRSYLQVFMLQAAILLIVDLPLIWLISSPARQLEPLAFLGAAIWLFGFLFESIADRQLAKFKREISNRGKLITHGLWSWSRHPNYFGEVVQWWGIAMITLPLSQGWITLISPLLITFLILKVSGVTMLEEQMKYRPGFKEYEQRTPKFFPRRPRG